MWTEERVETLKKFWAEGCSASVIAVRLGAVSRNAVIGKVHRLGLAGRSATFLQSLRKSSDFHWTDEARKEHSARLRLAHERKKQARRALAIKSPPTLKSYPLPPEPPTPAALKLTIEQLTPRSCRWPIGDPQREDFHYCGLSRLDGLPYCNFHARRAYQPSRTLYRALKAAA